MDRRLAPVVKWYEKVLNRNTVLVVDPETDELFEVEVKNEVCPRCDGEGQYVDPNIDSHGLTRDDFDADSDFERDYFRGTYDVPCVECNGSRVVKVPTERALDDKRLRTILDGVENDRRERAEEFRTQMRECGCWDY